jgi:hypothetical protein
VGWEKGKNKSAGRSHCPRKTMCAGLSVGWKQAVPVVETDGPMCLVLVERMLMSWSDAVAQAYAVFSHSRYIWTV